MKTFTILSLVLALSIARCLAGDIAPADAKSHIGETVTVKGTVEEVKVSAKAIFLDFGGKYPNQALTVYTPDTSLANALKAYEGKTISVTGKVQMYKGRPEIVLTALSQISQ